MKKIFSIFYVFIFLFSIGFAYQTYAEEVPGRMNPNAVIEFDENLKIKVINSGNVTFRSSAERSYEKLDLEKMSEKEKAEYFEEEKVFQEASEFAKKMPVTRVEIIPEPGMKVIYDSEGFVDKILYAGSLFRYNSLERGTTSPVGTYSWGNHNNTLVVTDRHVTGTGRFTVFDDEKGENSNVLKKGDCATRGDYDNPKHGQDIITRKLNNDLSSTNYTYTFSKRDNGALPDAILDIWKNGVEYLNESYS